MGTAGVGRVNMPKLLRLAYLGDQEELLRETRATGMYYFPAPVFWLVIFGLLDFSAASAEYGWTGVPGLTPAFAWLQGALGAYRADVLWALLLLSLIVALWLVVRYLRWSSTVYAVTTHRVIVQRGILGREFDEIPLLQVHGVDVHQSAAQRLLRYGSVRVSAEQGASSSIGNEAWRGIPRPFDFSRIIENASQRLVRPGAATAPTYSTRW